MKQENNPLTAQQSLDIITNMIRQAKGNMKENSYFFLLWGWVVTIASLGMFTLMQLGYEKPWLIWTITVPAWIWTMYSGYRQGKRESNSTPFDRITAALWISYGVIIFTFVIFGYKINYQLMPTILIITAVPATVSGIILKFKVLIYGGVIFWVGGILCFMVGYDFQYLIGAAAVILGYLVPGYALRNKNVS